MRRPSRFVIPALVLATLVVGGLFSPDQQWYSALVKPSWMPPGWLFGPVWLVLYVGIAIAGMRLWSVPDDQADQSSVRVSRWLWGVQLALNAAWSPLFFGLHQPLWALADILALLAILAACPGWFRHVSPLAVWLFVPYLLWVLFATMLNGWIAVANGG